MKNALNYYYNINVEVIRNVYGNYLFKSNNIKYMLKKIDGFSLSNTDFININQLIRYQIPLVSEAVVNTSGQLITIINDNSYILLRLQINDNYLIKDKDILAFGRVINMSQTLADKIDSSKWDIRWLQKIDYFELYINENFTNHQRYLYIYNYYIGLAELAVSLYRDAHKRWNDKVTLVAAHKRVKYRDTNIEFFDPTNIILDCRSRDIAEYYKNQILENKFDYSNFCQVITHMRLTKKEAQLFISRLLFPTYFFDVFEECINCSLNFEVIDKLLKGIELQENIIFEMIKYISDKYVLDIYEQIKR